jgi:hypothetical protein
MRMLPIGIQTFEDMRKGDYIYVDKTKEIYEMAKSGKFYFLSRPRRFGKSLLISAIKELFKGRKELFEGLYIYDKWDWSKKHPVIHLDFATIAYKSSDQLEISLLDFVNSTAFSYGVSLSNSTLSSRFAELIEKVSNKAGERTVILVDEYDKPLIDNLSDKEVYAQVKRTLHDFYQVIKAKDAHEKFVILTGVSQFSGLSVFSALNNLNNITMNSKYVSICGYTQEELEKSFKEHIESASEAMGLSKEKMLSQIKRWYNGYSWDAKTFVYNPFSTLLFFDNKKFGRYWFETGTPTFLIEQIRERDDLSPFIEETVVSSNSLSGASYDKIGSIALLFQTGYLTIKKEERVDERLEYRVDFPNMEVREAFLGSLLETYANMHPEKLGDTGKKIRRVIEKKDSEGLENILAELFAVIPYDLHIGMEKYYHSLFLMIMRLNGYEAEGEVHTDKGRIDAALKNDKSVIVVEIKYGQDRPAKNLAEEAMEQIKEKKYYEKYAGNEVSLLGIGFGKNKEIGCGFEGL